MSVGVVIVSSGSAANAPPRNKTKYKWMGKTDSPVCDFGESPCRQLIRDKFNFSSTDDESIGVHFLSLFLFLFLFLQT